MAEELRHWESERQKDMAEHSFQKLVHNKLWKELEECVNELANKAVEQVRQTDFQSPDRITNNNNNNNTSDCESINKRKKTNTRSRVSTGKVFVARQSLLTELLEIPHIRTIYHIFIVILIILFLNTVIYDLVDSGRINVGFSLIRAGFGKFGTVLYIWSFMQMIAFLPHPLLRLWAKYRQSISQFGKAVQIWDTAWICMLVAFQVTFMVLPIKSVLKYDLPIVSSLIILTEMVRFVMKMHAYVRSVCPRALHRPSAPSSTQPPTNIPLPPFSCYLYFLFAPTLVYRDSYPRTGHTRWGVVAARLLEIAAIIFYISFLCERFLVGNFSNFGKAGEVLEAKQVVVLVFGSMLPGLLTYLCGFYLLLHSWLNATSEALTFADRQFYMDWWNQSNYANFYRSWNMVVHDWLHAYIYKDMLILTGSRLLGTLLVFITSAIFHEIILSFALGFFYPVLLIMFGFFGVLLIFLTKQSNSSTGNIFMWWSLAVGNGILFCLYSMEYFARRNCPAGETGIWDFIIPRSWSCHQIAFHPDWKFQNPLDE